MEPRDQRLTADAVRDRLPKWQGWTGDTARRLQHSAGAMVTELDFAMIEAIEHAARAHGTEPTP